MSANLVDTFKKLNDLNLILQGKNINCINEYDAINTFMAKLDLGIIKFKKKMQLSFLNIDIALEKKQNELKSELKFKVEGHL